MRVMFSLTLLPGTGKNNGFDVLKRVTVDYTPVP
jgi:hypothetical protein